MGNKFVRPVEDRVAHGQGRIREVTDATEVQAELRERFTLEELRALGTVLTLEGDDPAYPLKLDSLQQLSSHRKTAKRPKWLLLSVLPARADAGLPERATIWVSDEYRSQFLGIFEDYLDKESSSGAPRNNELVANIARIRGSILADLWQSDGTPPEHEQRWWELWLRSSEDGPGLLRRTAESLGFAVSSRVLRLMDRDVMWVEASWEQLELLPFSAVPIAEIRRPGFVDTIEDVGLDEQAEYVEDLAARLEPATEGQPAVCHLDTGVARTHRLLEGSISPQDMHTVIGASGFDNDGHGTRMAGIALLGDVDGLLLGSETVRLRHRLESVRILPTNGEAQHDPLTYGDVTAQAISLPESTAIRARTFCMPVSAISDTPSAAGQPTLWSATIDALAAGTVVVRNGDELQLLGAPEPEAARLIVVSAGNVGNFVVDHLDESDTSAIEDPGQAWNALTIGAHTELVGVPTDPAYAGWTSLAPLGELSPHSRTSLLYGVRPWPIKPDVVLEGGNVLHDGGSMFEPGHPTLSIRTTGHGSDQALTSANATSAATAQAARLCTLAMAAYPEYWPETIRGLIVHSGKWTDKMRNAVVAQRKAGLASQQAMLRRYGWGVPTEDRVLYSADNAVTLVVQDSFKPFSGPDYKVPSFRLHDLPWPKEVLEELGDALVELRVTLSYFIEPTPSRRGWRQRYTYPSHGLRFELQDPLESESDFIRRVNRDAREEEDGGRPSAGQIKWMVGANQRNLGSLHQDIWETSGAELARSGRLAVYPVGGWWKRRAHPDRMDKEVRYSLIVSLKTASTGVDIYTPIATLLNVPIAVPIE
jgi:hypothetical protein